MGGIFKSITLKWVIFSVLLAIVPLVITGIHIVHIYQKDLMASMVAIEKEKASRAVEKTRDFLERVKSNLLILARDEGITRSGLTHAKKCLGNFLSQNDYIFELILMDEKGLEKVRVSKFKTEETHHQKDQSESLMFKVASKGGIFYGDFYYTSDGRLAITVAVPTEVHRETPVGVLKAGVDVEYLQEEIAKIKIHEKGFAYVVDREGFLIVHPREVNIQFGPFVEQAIAGEEGSLEFENLRGEKFLIVYKPIPELKWGVVVQAPVEEVYGPIEKITEVATQWLWIAFVVSLLVGLSFIKRLIRPIKQLSSQMAKVSGGDLDVQIETRRKDEIGRLTHSFNQMVQDLKASREAFRKAEEKYRRIFEESKDMVYITSADGTFIDVNQAGAEMLGYSRKEELMRVNVKDCYLKLEDQKRFRQKMAEDGFVKDFEVVLKRKDGTPVDCLITATARRDQKGDIIGYEGLVKDISYRKQMEEELFQRTKELEALYDLGVLVNQSLNLDLVFQIGLEKAMGITGFEIGALHVLSEDGETLELRYEKGHPPALVEKIKRFNKGEGVCGTVVERKEPFLIDIEEYPARRLIPLLKAQKIQTLAGIPLLSKGKAIGSITLLSGFHRQLTSKEVHLLESIGNQIGMALENAKLFASISKAKAEWETTFNTVTDLITVRDKDFRILQANRAAFIRYGLKTEEMIGRRCFEVLHHQDHPCEGCYVTEALRTGKPTSGERESSYLNGIFQYYTYPVYDDLGRIVAVVDLAREITEKKRLERENEVINNIYKILASSLNVRQAFKAVHSELKRVMDSQRMTIILLDGEKEEFQYYALENDNENQEIIEGVTYPLKNTFTEEVMRTGKPILASDIKNIEEGRYWIREKLLKEGIHSFIVFPLEYQGKIFGTMSLGSRMAGSFSERHLDILRQIAPGLSISIQNILLLNEIKGSEERYRTVVEGALDGVLVVGEDYRFQYVNERLAEMLGYPREVLIGSDFRNYLGEESRQMVEDRYARRQRGEKISSQYEFQVIRKDGELRNVEISSSIVRNAQGNISTIAFLKDVTEKKKMEEQLFQNEKLRALGEMASGVAHDFNNALAAILGNAQLLLYTAQDEESREALKTIEKVAKDSAQTVKRLQDFTRRRVEQKFYHLDINSVVRDVIEITKPKWKDEAQRRGLPIEINSRLEEVPGVEGNASELREVVTNILLNAIEAMPEGGKIEIRTFERNQQIHLQITDTGIGMTEGVKKKIFEPFFTTKPFTNTGLGLSVSYGIVKRFGGEIEVQSKVGLGTTFTIVLPSAREKNEEAESHSVFNGSRSARILVIDDEEHVREVLSKMLSQFNHRVTVAESGEEGIRLFGQERFDMVLTDLGMPGMSGWEVCKSIKEMRPSIPVGMITGWGLEVDEYQKTEAGLDFIITKPFDFDQIIRVVSEKIEPMASSFS